MNQRLLQHIYSSYQPNQYYTKYLVDNKIRPDSRRLHQCRPLRISINVNNNKSDSDSSVTVSRGSTLVIVQLTGLKVEPVVYSSTSNTYGRQLLQIKVNTQGISNTSSRSTKNDKNMGKSIQQYINQFINWKQIQQQLVYTHIQKGTTYAQTGSIIIRVADSDGCLKQTILLAVQCLLWTVQFGSLEQHIKQKKQIIKCKKVPLKLSKFYYPVKYVQILSELLPDPTSAQQSSSNYELTLLKDMLSKSTSIIRVLHVHKPNSLPLQVIQSIEKLYQGQLSKLPFDIREIQKKCVQTGSYQATVDIVSV